MSIKMNATSVTRECPLFGGFTVYIYIIHAYSMRISRKDIHADRVTADTAQIALGEISVSCTRYARIQMI